MRPTNFPEQNDILRGGHESVFDLPIFRDGNEVISCWTPTPAELMELNATGRLWLRVQAPTHPPLLPTGLYPFEQVKN